MALASAIVAQVKKNMRVVRQSVDSNCPFSVAADASRYDKFRLTSLDMEVDDLCTDTRWICLDERVRHGLCRPFRA